MNFHFQPTELFCFHGEIYSFLFHTTYMQPIARRSQKDKLVLRYSVANIFQWLLSLLSTLYPDPLNNPAGVCTQQSEVGREIQVWMQLWPRYLTPLLLFSHWKLVNREPYFTEVLRRETRRSLSVCHTCGKLTKDTSHYPCPSHLGLLISQVKPFPFLLRC